MNEERANVPTLCVDTCNLNNLLSELPLPSASHFVEQRSLLSHLWDANEAHHILNTLDTDLISLLTDVLDFTSTEYIELKVDRSEREMICSGKLSLLARYLLTINVGLFQSDGFQDETVGHRVSPEQCCNISPRSQRELVCSSVASNQSFDSQSSDWQEKTGRLLTESAVFSPGKGVMESRGTPSQLYTPQITNSSFVHQQIINVVQSPPVDNSFNTDSCVGDEDNPLITKQNLSRDPFTVQPENLSSLVVAATAPIIHCIKKSPFADEYQFVPRKLGNYSVPDTGVNKTVNGMQNSEDKVKENCLRAAVVSAHSLSLRKPVVVLEKFSLEDLLRMQKRYNKVMAENKKDYVFPESEEFSSQNISTIVNHRHQSKKSADFSPSHRRNCVDEYFTNQGNSDPVKDGVSKQYVGAFPQNVDCVPINQLKRKRGSIKSKTNCIESPDSEGEKREIHREESPKCVDATSSVTPVCIKKSKKKKKAKKELVTELLSVEDLIDSNVYKNFSCIVETIFDSTEDIDFSSTIGEDAKCASEGLIPLPQLQKLSSEAAKLKALDVMKHFSSEKLVRLLVILGYNVIDGAKLPPVLLEEQDEEEERLWSELTMKRVMRSTYASLTALYIMTSPEIPEKVFLEDTIEKIVLFLKYQLEFTIFPLFDPVYRFDSKSKNGYSGNIKQKRAGSHKVKKKSILQLYNRLHEAVSLLSELVKLQVLTDAIILHISLLSVSSFFVEGISELQLSALHLVTNIFTKYDKHREHILEDILSSIVRLPNSKGSVRNYHLNSNKNIQMLTALVLQLVHSVVHLPEPTINPRPELSSSKLKGKICTDKDIHIINSYEASMKIAISFLYAFLKKCGIKMDETDYRPLFQNFIQDLLCTAYKPEWPASEMFLSVFGRILVQNLSNKSTEMPLRLVSLDYLGTLAAHLCKDAASLSESKDKINDVIQKCVINSDDTCLGLHESKKKNKKSLKYDEMQILQKVFLQYLDSRIISDPSLQFSRRFYIAQWYRDAVLEIAHSNKRLVLPTEEPDLVIEDNNEQSTCVTGYKNLTQFAFEEGIKKEETKLERNEINALMLEERKQFLLTVIDPKQSSKTNSKKEHVDCKTAELILQYLAADRYFSNSFDLYLSQILQVLSENSVAVRTKAVKCLTVVVEADPSILARPDVQKSIHGRLLDQSTSAREASVDLLGKFILLRPELISQYYEMLMTRILDTGVSVRKRVIKILRDICLEHPDFPKVPDICVKMIRRVNDEEGIRKLVGEVFQSMWFSPTSNKTQERILHKVRNIICVVEKCRNIGLEWFQQLLTSMLKNKDKAVLNSCNKIVNCLVENILKLEESSQNIDGGASPQLVACLETLYLFCKIHPPFVVPHASTIEPYLSVKCNSQSDFVLLKNVAQTLELTVPLIEHPSEKFLARIEEEMVKLILCQHIGLLPSCVSCLGAVVNKVTHNYQLVKDCFQKFFIVLLMCKREYEKNPDSEILKSVKSKLLRSLYTIGLFCFHFGCDVIDVDSDQNGDSFTNRIFECIMCFSPHHDGDIRLKALTSLGFIMARHCEFMLRPGVKTLYRDILTSPAVSSALKCQILKNIANYLIEEDMQMNKRDAEWSKMSKLEDLKEMCDEMSGMASTVVQVYLEQILECVLHSERSVRKATLLLIQLVVRQGLINPIGIIPHLACLGSDDDPAIHTKCHQLLQEVGKKYPDFIHTKALIAVRLSYKLQQRIHQDPDGIVRGFRFPEDPVSRNGVLYSVIRPAKQNRRAFLCSLLRLFDEQSQTPLAELLYVADNIVYFPYVLQDEPLFLMHHLDLILSVSGSNLLQTFRENITNMETEDFDDDITIILQNLPKHMGVLQECIVASQGCILLLYVKHTLKEMYAIMDNKIQQYSPSDSTKVYDRPLNRKSLIQFNPESVINFLRSQESQDELDEQGKKTLVLQYLHFKELMLAVDPSRDDCEDENIPLVLTDPVVPQVTKASIVTESNVEDNVCKSVSRAKLPKTLKGKPERKRKRKKKLIMSASDDSDDDPDYVI